MVCLRSDGTVDEVKSFYNAEKNKIEYQDNKFGTYVLYYNTKAKTTKPNEILLNLSIILSP